MINRKGTTRMQHAKWLIGGYTTVSTVLSVPTSEGVAVVSSSLEPPSNPAMEPSPSPVVAVFALFSSSSISVDLSPSLLELLVVLRLTTLTSTDALSPRPAAPRLAASQPSLEEGMGE